MYGLSEGVRLCLAAFQIAVTVRLVSMEIKLMENDKR